jgi:hypothetical protein
MKPLGALGLCAMAVPDRADAASDFSEALASLEYLLNSYQGEAEGGYGEGWTYLVYGGQSFVPFLYAVHRTAPGARWRVRGEGTLVPDDPNAGRTIDILDLAQHPVTRGVFLGMLQATRPDGRTPPIDDANPGAMPGGLLSAWFDDRRFLWNWEKPAVNYASPRSATASFAAVDPAWTAQPPDWDLDLFLPEAGYSVLRTSWDPEQLYVHMVHEHGRMRTSGYSHEHADNLSLSVYAYGEPLIIDPGYIQWSEHFRVKYGHDHNLVLVDGEGPPYPAIDQIAQTAPTADAFLHEGETAGSFSTALASTRYEGALLARRVVRLHEQLVVVADALSDDAGEPRTWTWQINGYAGGTVPASTFTADALGGTWERNTARVQVAVAPTVGTPDWEQTLEDSLNTDGWREHVRRAATVTMGDHAGFLAVIAPSPTEGSLWEFEDVNPVPGVVALVVEGDSSGVVTLNRTATAVTFTVDEQEVTAAPGLTWFDANDDATLWSLETPEIPQSEE